MSSSENDLALEEEHTGVIKNESEMFERAVYMPTLPSSFNSLVGKTVKIEMEEPRYVVELLGDLLGVTDYKTNKAAFWFLDTLALQVLRYKDTLDDHYRSVLISWLAGEMKLIRDKKLLREDFFKEMRILFLHVAEELSNGDQLLHWELVVDEFKIVSKCSTISASITHETSVANDSSEKSLKKSDISLTVENTRTYLTDINTVAGSPSLLNPSTVLDIIIEATYSMYANELRYALVYEVFVTPIQMQTYHMPHTLRVPRQIKLADVKGGTFDIQLQERLKKIANEIAKKDKSKERENINMKKGQTINELNTEIPPTPTSSLIEEEILANNRRFILPLIEAKETMQIFEMYTRDV